MGVHNVGGGEKGKYHLNSIGCGISSFFLLFFGCCDWLA
jgi:hypothetical protein